MKPLASIGVGLGTASYADELAPPPPDGPVGPRVSRREVRLESQLGVQLGRYPGGAFSIAFAPYWRISDDPSALFDGYTIIAAWSVPD